MYNVNNIYLFDHTGHCICYFGIQRLAKLPVVKSGEIINAQPMARVVCLFAPVYQREQRELVIYKCSLNENVYLKDG